MIDRVPGAKREYTSGKPLASRLLLLYPRHLPYKRKHQLNIYNPRGTREGELDYKKR